MIGGFRATEGNVMLFKTSLFFHHFTESNWIRLVFVKVSHLEYPKICIKVHICKIAALYSIWLQLTKASDLKSFPYMYLPRPVSRMGTIY